MIIGVELAVFIALAIGFFGLCMAWYALFLVWSVQKSVDFCRSEKEAIGILECEIQDLRKHLMKIKR